MNCYVATSNMETFMVCYSPCITKIILDRGVKVTAELIEKHCHRSPLVKGELEIPCKVSVSLFGISVNLLF